MSATPTKLKQTRLSFPVISSPIQGQPTPPSNPKGEGKGKDRATKMTTPSPSKEEMADDWKEVDPSTPIKKSNVAVIIYTPRKTHVLRDGASKYLPTPAQSSQQMPEGASADLPEIELSLDRGHNPRTSSSAPQLRRTHERLRLQAGAGNTCTAMSSPAKETVPSVVSIGSSSDSDVELRSDEASSEHDNSPAPRQVQLKTPAKPSRRTISARSFISGGHIDNLPLPSSSQVTSKSTRASKNRTKDSSSKRSARSQSDKVTTRLGAEARSRDTIQNPDEGKTKGKLRRQKDSSRTKESGDLPEKDGSLEGQSIGKARKHQRVEESDEDDVVISRVKRRRSRLGSSDRAVSSGMDDGEGEEEEKKEEKGPRTRHRDRGAKPQMTRKQKLLDELRKRRAGLSLAKGADLPSSPEFEVRKAPKRALYDTESDNGSDEEDEEDDEDEESGTEAIRKSLRGGRSNEYDRDFVVSDDEETLGAPSFGPGRLDIPIEFTMRAHKKTREHFKDAIEWMVHNRLNPAFDRKGGVYRVAFQKLDTEALAYSTSKFISSVWTPEFTRALKSRPDLYKEEMASGEKDCDACKRKNHSATFKVKFSGKPYHRESLENISSPSDDEGDEEDSVKEYDSEGNSVPDVDTVFYLGRFCYQNAHTAHALIHWRYHLNQWVGEYLEERGLFEANEILKRESWGSKKRGTFADEIVDELEKKGEIGSLYRDFKTNLEEARNAKNNRVTKK